MSICWWPSAAPAAPSRAPDDEPTRATADRRIGPDRPAPDRRRAARPRRRPGSTGRRRLAGAQVEPLLVHRRRHRRPIADRADDAPRQHRGAAERVDVVDGVRARRAAGVHRNTATARPPTSAAHAAVGRPGRRTRAHRRTQPVGQPTRRSARPAVPSIGHRHRIATATSRSTRSLVGRWPDGSGPAPRRTRCVGSGWSGALTNDTNRATRSGCSMVAFHSHS